MDKDTDRPVFCILNTIETMNGGPSMCVAAYTQRSTSSRARKRGELDIYVQSANFIIWSVFYLSRTISFNSFSWGCPFIV